jgi:uncharacterized protein with HEPN domain
MGFPKNDTALHRWIEGSFLADEKTIDAVVRNLEIIGEAAKLRNRIVHDYAGIDLKLVWNILQTAIPKLALQIAELK